MIPEYYTWTDKGKTYTQITAPTKRAILAEYAARYNLKTFVETGTCNGDCLMALHGLFDHSYSIELLDWQFAFTRQKLQDFPDITLLHGNSGIAIVSVLEDLRGPTLFWLDAHGEDWKGPIVQELEAIFRTAVKGAILIDDMDYITDVLPTDPRWKEESREYGIVRLLNVG